MFFLKMLFALPSGFAAFSGTAILGSVFLALVGGCQAPSTRQNEPSVQPAAIVVPAVKQSQPGTSKPVVSLPVFSEDVLRLQIFLDGENFCPGLVDGRMGDFTEKVRKMYESKYGSIQPNALFSPYTTYTIQEADLARIGRMGSGYREISLQRSTPYTELIAFVAERYHTSRAFLREINPGVNFSQLHASDSVRVPNIRAPFKIEDYAPATTTPPDPARKQRMVHVDTQRRLLEVTDSGKMLAVFPITPGSKDLPAPPGTWVIRGIVAMPWYRYDEGVLKRGVRTANFLMLPPGPRNPVGILFAGLNKPGIGIHGTNSPETIGRSSSHGCIRLSNWDAARFRKLVTVGNTVIIQ